MTALQEQLEAQVKRDNPRWFEPATKRSFGDVAYTVRVAHSGQAYLVRSTYAWTDMGGKGKKLHYRLNPLRWEDSHLRISHLLDEVFETRQEVGAWLKAH